MNHIERDLLSESKEILEKRPMEFFQEHVRDCLETEYPCRIDWILLFQKLYLHACLKGKKEAADWLATDVYERLDPIQKIALRQVFSYGRYLLSKKH